MESCFRRWKRFDMDEPNEVLDFKEGVRIGSWALLGFESAKIDPVCVCAGDVRY